MLRAVARKVLPEPVRRFIRNPGKALENARTKALLKRFAQMKAGDVASFDQYAMRINDGRNFVVLYSDIFLKRIYHFDAVRPAPYILDCGSNIGMSILYYKHVYPDARIIGFEPDSTVFRYLEENIQKNGLKGVQVFKAAISSMEGTQQLYSDGKYASYLADLQPAANSNWAQEEVPSKRLRDYLNEPVDFLKMNIEGAEWPVLSDSADLLHHIREMVIEYHHLPGLPRTLHKILSLLDEKGFEYLINDLDPLSNSAAVPPFHLDENTSYFLLIYARNLSAGKS